MGVGPPHPAATGHAASVSVPRVRRTVGPRRRTSVAITPESQQSLWPSRGAHQINSIRRRVSVVAVVPHARALRRRYPHRPRELRHRRLRQHRAPRGPASSAGAASDPFSPPRRCGVANSRDRADSTFPCRGAQTPSSIQPLCSAPPASIPARGFPHRPPPRHRQFHPPRRSRARASPPPRTAREGRSRRHRASVASCSASADCRAPYRGAPPASWTRRRFNAVPAPTPAQAYRRRRPSRVNFSGTPRVDHPSPSWERTACRARPA